MAEFTVTVMRNGKRIENARVRIWGSGFLQGYLDNNTNGQGQAGFRTNMSSGKIYVNGDLKNHDCRFKGELTVHLWSADPLSQTQRLGFFLRFGLHVHQLEQKLL